MIDYIKGDLIELTPTQAIIDATGVGYTLNISLQTYSAIQGKPVAKLFVYEQIREDAWTFFGFSTKTERELFLMLITVSGVGGNTARMILSSFSPMELSQTILAGNEQMLKGIKGIGLKTAQRIIVELKDKLENSTLSDTEICKGKTLSTLNTEKQEEAVAALTMLGFAPVPSKKIVMKILEQDSQTPVETIVKQALKML